MTIFVTGGAGFIGSNFINDWFSQSEEALINLDALKYAGNPQNLRAQATNDNYTFVHGDICDAALLADLFFKYQPRAVVHFAAESHVDRSIKSPREFIDSNIIGTFTLLEESKKFFEGLSRDAQNEFRFLHVSTDEVYGTLSPEDERFTETNQYAPNSPYSASKAASDHLVRAYFHTYGLPVLTTNCSNNYGPFQFPEKLIPLVINNALSYKPLPIYGDGMQIRDWLYVGDHCSAVRRVLSKGVTGEVYNIGGLNEMANLEIVTKICELLDELEPPKGEIASYKELISFVEDRPGHDRRYAIDPVKIENELNWSPSETFDSGILKTVKWYLDNKTWVAQVMNGQYQQSKPKSSA